MRFCCLKILSYLNSPDSIHTDIRIIILWVCFSQKPFCSLLVKPFALRDHMQVEHRESNNISCVYAMDHPLVLELEVQFVWHQNREGSLSFWLNAKDISTSSNEAKHLGAHAERIENPERIVSQMADNSILRALESVERVAYYLCH